MSTLEGMTIRGYSCDGNRCTERVEGDAMPWRDGVHHYQAVARAAGWTFWASRSLRSYCPDHRPSKASSMREVTQ